MIDFELNWEYDACLDSESKFYDSVPCVNKHVDRKFGSKVFLSLFFFTATASNSICQDLNFELETGNSNVILECVEANLQNQTNRFLLDSSLEKIQNYPDSWWKEYNADKPEQVTFDNVAHFLDYNEKDLLLSGAEVLPEPNATLLIEWNMDSFMCSLNIGEAEFSYSILPFKDLDNPLLGQASLRDKNAICEFFSRLESVYV